MATFFIRQIRPNHNHNSCKDHSNVNATRSPPLSADCRAKRQARVMAMASLALTGQAGPPAHCSAKASSMAADLTPGKWRWPSLSIKCVFSLLISIWPLMPTMRRRSSPCVGAAAGRRKSMLVAPITPFSMANWQWALTSRSPLVAIADGRMQGGDGFEFTAGEPA